MKKLIKYDVKKMLGTLPYFYLFTICFASLTRIVNIWSDIQFIFIIGQVLQGTAIALMVNILVNTFINVIVRSFVTSFYKDESYLTHTLPVTKEKLLNSKIISAVILTLLGVLVCFASLFIMFYSSEFASLIKTLINSMVVGLDMSGGTFVTIIVLLFFIEIIALLLIGFSAVVKGYSYNHKKVKMSFIWFIIYYAVSVVASLIVMVVVLAISGNISALTATVMEASAFTTILIVGLINYFIMAVVFYFICRKQFSRGVNVD